MEVRGVRDDEADIAEDLVVAAYRAIEGTPPVEGGRLLGCATYMPDENSPMAEDLQAWEVRIRMLAVDPAGQRRGVGRALVDACSARARAAGKARLFLHSGAWMDAAHALYESMGFRRVPERDWLPEPDMQCSHSPSTSSPQAYSQGA
jgi:ribosomal protein S18 acetylase RimI-like enzyme